MLLVVDPYRSCLSEFDISEPGTFLGDVYLFKPCDRLIDAVPTKTGWLLTCTDGIAQVTATSTTGPRADAVYVQRYSKCESLPCMAADVPGWGVLALDDRSRFKMFVKPDFVRMRAMSLARVAWMNAVIRAVPAHYNE